MRRQAEIAMDMADVICFFTDARAGLTPDDEEVANLLRRTRKPVLVAVNKMDHAGLSDVLYEFYALGLGDPIGVSAANMLGLGDLLDEIVKRLPPKREDEADEESEDYGLVILKSVTENGEELLSTLDDEAELEKIYELFMEQLLADEE